MTVPVWVAERVAVLDREAAYVAAQVGPRVVGGRYVSAFGSEYEVLAIDRARREGWSWSITVRLADGRVVTHSTAWHRLDRAI